MDSPTTSMSESSESPPPTTSTATAMPIIIFKQTRSNSPLPGTSEPQFKIPNISDENDEEKEVDVVNPDPSPSENPPASSSAPILVFKNIRRSPSPSSSEPSHKMTKMSPSSDKDEKERELAIVEPGTLPKVYPPIGSFIYRRRNYTLPNTVPTQHALENSHQYADKMIAGCRTAPLKSDPLVWPFVITGPLGSVYQGARFFGRFTFASEQIDKFPPHVKFDSLFFHPDCSKDGKLDTRILEREWNETKSIADVIHFVVWKMENPKICKSIDPHFFYYPRVAALSKVFPERFEMLAREATKQLM